MGGGVVEVERVQEEAVTFTSSGLKLAGVLGVPGGLNAPARDSVAPTKQSVEMFKRAGQPAELHLFGDVDHFMFAEGSTRVWSVVHDWLQRYFPAKV